MRILIIEPSLGLGNRIRALDSAIAYSEAKNCKLVVIWISNSECNSRFTDLFELPEELFQLIEVNSGLLSKMLLKLVKAILQIFLNNYLNNKRTIQLKKETGSFCKGITRFLEKPRTMNVVYLQSFSRFFRSSKTPPYDKFVPIKNIQNIINQYDLENTVGIHVRRTDHERSIKRSPLSGFIEAMNDELSSDQKVKFFLATDDPQTEIELKNKFPNRVMVHPKPSLDRNDPLAVRDAVVDLYCLANCKKLIGSYRSSFSETAYEIKGIPNIIVDSKK